MPHVPRNQCLYPNAYQVSYDPVLASDWSGYVVDNSGTALDVLAERVSDIEINGGGGSGTSGYSGYSGLGLSGFSGYSGLSGFSGYSSLSGFSGYSSLSGFSGYSSLSGFSGYSSLSGFSGYVGGFGGDSQSFAWTTTLSSAGDSQVGFDSATYSSVIAIWIDTLNFNATNIASWRGTLHSAVNNTIKIFSIVNNNTFAHFRVTSTNVAVGGANDIGIGVAYIGHNGTFTNGEQVVVTTGRAGLSGFSGYSGRSGFSGYSGVSGFSGYSSLSGFSGYSSLSGFSGYSGLSGFSGYSGLSGFSGYSGLSGFSGYSSLSGYSGYSGLSGFSGYSSLSGFSGYSSLSGFSGYSGLSGFSGYSSLSGFSGYSSLSGFSGYSGLSGFSGYSSLSGFSGYSSLSGFSGYSSLSGFSGYSGLSGFSGYSGLSGFSGYSSLSGFSGYSSLSGFSGYSSLSGFSGYSGLSGFSGYSSLSGFSGYSGLSGFSGYSGLSGFSGYSSLSGFSGYSSLSGFSGYSGLSGFSGYSSLSGFSGYSGLSGFSGYSGLSGFSGYSSLSGFSGYSGLSGFSGYSGLSGFSGYLGAFGGDSQSFKWTTNLSVAAATEAGFDSATYSSVTAFWIDVLNFNATNISGWRGTLYSFANNTIKIFSLTNSNTYAHFRVTSTDVAIGGGDDIGISVSYISHNGSFTNGEQVVVTTGRAGTSGFSGYSGKSGFSGYSGLSGFSGYSSLSGFSGYSSLSGFSGYSSLSGFSGYSGVDGLSGFSGYSGLGLSGFSGYSGLSGFSGYSSLSGFSGYSSLSGFSGYSSLSGFSGYSGNSSGPNFTNIAVTTTATTTVPAIFTEIAAQTADIIQCKNDTGTILTKIDSAGYVGVGWDTTAITFAFDAQFSSASSNGMRIRQNQGGSTPAVIQYVKTRSSGVVTSGDRIGEFNFLFHDGTAIRSMANFGVRSSGSPANNNSPCQMWFGCTPGWTSTNGYGDATGQLIFDGPAATTTIGQNIGTGGTVAQTTAVLGVINNTTTKIVGLFKAKASQSANILEAQDSSANVLVAIGPAGGLKIKTGTNQRMGTAVLVAGTITVTNTSVTANTLIFLSVTTAGGTQGFLSSTLVASTSFTINSTNAADTSTVAWLLMEPA